MLWQVLIIIAGVLLALVFVFWLGLRKRPKPLPPYPETTPNLETIPLPDGLPTPVERFYRTLYGDRVPLIESAVISGLGKVRFSGLTLQARWRFTHTVGQDYRHYIETTIFSVPLLKVNEWFLDGESRLELPGGVVENDPKVNQAGNLGLWAESAWLPAIYLTDPRVNWKPVDDHTALLVVPFGEREETFIVRFDPQSGMLRFLEVMRYKEAEKVLWINEVMDWDESRGIFTKGAVTWFGDGKPWAIFMVEEIVYNVDVSEYVRGSGY